LLTQFIYAFRFYDSYNTDYFPIQNSLTFFLMATDCVFCELQTEYIQRRSISVAGFSPLRLGFELRSDHVTLGWTNWHGAGSSPHHFGFPLSVSFHQRNILIFIYMSLYQKDKRTTPGNLLYSNASIGQ